jgi:L-arabinose isomerase
MEASCQTSRPPLRVGLFGIGLDVYWPQFAGLQERLEGYLRRVADKLHPSSTVP